MTLAKVPLDFARWLAMMTALDPVAELAVVAELAIVAQLATVANLATVARLATATVARVGQVAGLLPVARVGSLEMVTNMAVKAAEEMEVATARKHQYPHHPWCW